MNLPLFTPMIRRTSLPLWQNLAWSACLLGSLLVPPAGAQKLLSGVQPIKDPLVYRIPEGKPVSLLLSKTKYPAEDGFLDAIVWVSPAEGKKIPKGSLRVTVLNEEGKVLGREETPLPGERTFLSARLPEALAGRPGALEVAWVEKGNVLGSARESFQVLPAVAREQTGSIAVEIPNESSITAEGVPFTVGVPFPRGAIMDATALQLADEKGEPLPFQVVETARWSRFGSVKWVKLDFPLSLRGAKRTVHLNYGTPRPAAKKPPFLTPRVNGFPAVHGKRLRVENGIQMQGPDGRWETVLDAAALRGAYVEAEDGTRYEADGDAAFEIEEQGPEKVTVARRGWYRNGERKFCQYVTRFVLFKESPLIQIFHTWIYTGDAWRDRIRDIGWHFPASAGAAPLGFPGEGSAPWTAGTRLLQYDDDRFEITGSGGTAQKDGRAPGLMGLGTEKHAVVLGVRDFWQNYPQELDQDSGGMTYHLWPRHGKPARHPLAIGNALRLWFAHEGTVLDFSIPFEWTRKAEFYYTAPGPEARRKFHNGNGNIQAMVNAQGIAKTSEIWLYFGKASEAPAMAETLKALDQWKLRAVVDPVWLCGSGALHEMHPRDPENFPREEEAYALQAAAPLQWIDRIHFYGKWNWGDMTWEPDIVDRWSGFYRGFRKAHQGWPYSWMPYARSGDPRFRTLAEAASRHQEDVAFCHYSDSRVPTPGTDRPRPHGFYIRFSIPWGSPGDGTPSSRGYIDKSNYLWNHYYLTGYTRARDVALEFANATKYDGGNNFGMTRDDRTNYNPPADPAHPGDWIRSSQTVLQNAVDMYEATFDPWFLAEAHQVARVQAEYFRQTGWKGQYWNPGPRDFLRFTGSETYRPFYEAYAEKWTAREGEFIHYTNSYPMMEPAAYMALTGGKPFFLRRLRAMVNEMVDWTYGGAPDYAKGCRVGNNWAPMYTGFLLQQLPAALHALHAAKEPVAPLYGNFRQLPAPETNAFPEIRVRKPSGEPRTLRLLANHLPQDAAWSVAFSGPETAANLPQQVRWAATGAETGGPLSVKRLPFESAIQGQFVPGASILETTLPAGLPAGVYGIAVEGSGDSRSLSPGKVDQRPSLSVPCSAEPGPEVFRLGSGNRVGPAYPFGRYVFEVPATGKPLRFRVRTGGGNLFKMTVYDDREHPVALLEKSRTVLKDGVAVLEVPVTPGDAGKIWELVVGQAHNGVEFDPAIRPWVSTQREFWFNPEAPAP